MKANELMIGDWVNHLNKSQRIKGAVDFTYANDFAPIPLTAEILEKNGFSLTTDDTFHNDEGVGVAFENEEQFPAIIISLEGEDKSHMELIHPSGHIIYIHELQHALRLCGLTKLADNFKV